MGLQANELRIGNLVLDHVGRIQTVAETREDSYICYLSNGTKLKYKLNTTKPLPLTEELLLKFGFKDNEGLFKFENDSFEFTIAFYDGWNLHYKEKEVFGYGELNMVGYWYTHEFQNLYFALTGEELTLTKTNDPL